MFRTLPLFCPHKASSKKVENLKKYGNIGNCFGALEWWHRDCISEIYPNYRWLSYIYIASNFSLILLKTQLFEAENMFQRRSLKLWKECRVFKEKLILPTARSDKGIPTDEINIFEFELLSTVNQTVSLTYSFLHRKWGLLCISWNFFHGSILQNTFDIASAQITQRRLPREPSIDSNFFSSNQ